MEQVIRFQNANVENARAAAPVRAEGVPPPAMLQPLRDMVFNTVMHFNNALRRFSPVAPRRPQPAEDAMNQRLETQQPRPLDNENSLTRLTGPLTYTPWRWDPVAPPFSNVRSAQDVTPRPSLRQPRPRPRSRRQAQTRASSRRSTTSALIVLDDSDIENATVERRTDRRVELRQAARGQTSRPIEVIDLTVDDDDTIDLTKDD